jgi:hypothetical protein
LPGQSARWISPQKLTDDNGLVLLSDMNDWSPLYGQTFALHGKNGLILQGIDPSNGVRPVLPPPASAPLAATSACWTAPCRGNKSSR